MYDADELKMALRQANLYLIAAMAIAEGLDKDEIHQDPAELKGIQEAIGYTDCAMGEVELISTKLATLAGHFDSVITSDLAASDDD